MKDASGVQWPVHPATVGAFGPLFGRSDEAAGDAEFHPTPSSTPEEVPEETSPEE